MFSKILIIEFENVSTNLSKVIKTKHHHNFLLLAIILLM